MKIGEAAAAEDQIVGAAALKVAWCLRFRVETGRIFQCPLHYDTSVRVPPNVVIC